jgi:enoyl-CoA hydratase/carnithine racemase
MNHIRTETDDRLLIITMARGKANALNAEMVEEMNATIASAASEDQVRGVVIASDRPRFFSGGFDAMEVFQYDRETMTEFFGRFIDLYEGLVNLPKPVVASVSGHAFAGGAVLALASDARVMARGPFGFALNEINLGLALPPGMIRMAAAAVGARCAREMVLEGVTFTPQQSLDAGLASELADSEAVLEQAVERARELAAKPPLTFATIKRSLNEVTGRIAPDGDRAHLSAFIEHWFSAESKHHRQTLIESLRR